MQIVVFADPQLTDRTSYKFASGGPLLWFLRLLCDSHLARTAQLARHLPRGGPDVVVFLGDLMDGGWRFGEAEFNAEWSRFRQIFWFNYGLHPYHKYASVSVAAKRK